MPRKLPASRGEIRSVQRQTRNRYIKRNKDDVMNGDTTDDDRGGDVTSRDASCDNPGQTHDS